MTITRCDRCREETKPVNVTKIKIFPAKSVLVYNFDLCPKCEKELKGWIQETQEETNGTDI